MTRLSVLNLAVCQNQLTNAEILAPRPLVYGFAGNAAMLPNQGQQRRGVAAVLYFRNLAY
jgi:hypothetical protein